MTPSDRGPLDVVPIWLRFVMWKEKEKHIPIHASVVLYMYGKKYEKSLVC